MPKFMSQSVLAARHPTGVLNFEMAGRFLFNLCTPAQNNGQRPKRYSSLLQKKNLVGILSV